ncbi:hypothetical protein C474_15924 [Halogeometricum pallidum JCM 14848]|uniref:Uncharacterized protein n=1 Tax=Halogeometricum pallidum JCM 14848 TaxID=1227487 RepID=M0D1J9_HALPD|nr:hypothetical protein [Halogeometricum pallidum]ELZ28004.1 hypothetical protein C474_15924 [Halogeometricum pallidum JCM 14848]
MADRYRANYALLPILEQLGPDGDGLDVPWATFAGDRTSEHEFTVPVDATTDAYVELQAYKVGTYGHEILLNGEPLTGFDVPPAEGWQYWMDAVSGGELRKGENTLRIRRDASEDDSFAVGNVVVHWKEPVG